MIAAFSIWSIILDFSRFVNLDYTYDIYPSAVLKRINVILAVAIAWFVDKDGLNQRDSRRMKGALLFAFLGEAAFTIGARVIGIGMFAVCQTFLIVRNSTGFSDKLVYATNKQRVKLHLSSIVIILIIAAFTVSFKYLVVFESSTVAAYLYGILLSTSLWVGLANHILGLLPVRNSKLIAFGMVCFYCCDILVGFDAVFKPGLPWLLANSLIWVFYIPALVFLALSCYKYSENRKTY